MTGPAQPSWTSPPASTGCPKANAAKARSSASWAGWEPSGNAIADEPSTDGVGVGVDSDIATEPAPAQRGDTATWHCVSIDGEPRNWITRPVLADMDELSIIVEEG